MRGRGGRSRRGSSSGEAHAGSSADARAELGHAGEEAAAAFLAQQGLVVRERRFRCPYGEVDLIAEDARGELLVVCEVKARSFRRDAEPMLEAVPRAKRLRMARCALAYIALLGEERALRFDVLAVGTGPEGRPQVFAHLVDAFPCDDLDVEA